MPHLFHDTVILTDQRHAWDLLYGANDWMSFQGGLNDVITAAGSGMQQVDLFDAKHMTIDDLNPGDFILGVRCAIHNLGKPAICQTLRHHNGNIVGGENTDVVDAWDKPRHQKMIHDLLGEKPAASDCDVDLLLSSLCDIYTGV